jgi:penicillin-binding protein 1A
MAIAVARRPVEQFETQVPIPDWELTPEEELFGDTGLENGLQPLVDEYGNPLQTPPPQQPGAPESMVRPDGTGEPNQQELGPPAALPRQPLPQPRQPERLAPPKPAEPRPGTP